MCTMHDSNAPLPIAILGNQRYDESTPLYPPEIHATRHTGLGRCQIQHQELEAPSLSVH